MLLDSTSPKRKPGVTANRNSRGHTQASSRKAKAIASDLRRTIFKTSLRTAAAELLMSELMNFAKLNPLADSAKLVIQATPYLPPRWATPTPGPLPTRFVPSSENSNRT